MVGFVTGCLISVFFYLDKRIKRRGLKIVAYTALPVALFSIAAAAMNRIYVAVNSIRDIWYGITTLSSRTEIWASVIPLTRDYPHMLFCGLPVESAMDMVNVYLTDLEYIVNMHNAWLQTLIHLGLPGLLAVVWFILCLLRVIIRLAKNADTPTKQLAVVPVVLLSVLLVPSMGVDGVYIANVLNGVATTVTVVLYAVVKNRGVPENMEQLMVIPKDFGAAEDDIIDITVNKMEQVVNISQQVQRFCLSKGIDTRRAFFAALAVEELAGNVVEHGFKKDNKDHSADIRVVCKGQDIILRIKDDCQPFNPQEYRNMINPQDSAKNIGIRIVFAMDSEVKYQNILGLNAITIKM